MKRAYSKAQLAALRKIEPGNTTQNEIKSVVLARLLPDKLVERRKRGYIAITQAGLDILYPPSTLAIPDTSHLPGTWNVVIGRNGGIRGTVQLNGTTFSFGYLWRNGEPAVGMDKLNDDIPRSIYGLLKQYPGI